MGGCTVYSSPKVEPFYQVPYAIYPDFPENLQATSSLYHKIVKFKLLVRFSTRDFFFRGFLGSNCAAFNIDHISVDLFEKTLEEASISSS